MLRNASQVREVVRAESKPIYLRATVGFGLPAGKAVDISETIKVTDAEVDVVDGDRPSWSMDTVQHTLSFRVIMLNATLKVIP